MNQPISFAPEGCDNCGATALNPVGAGKFQCAYCGAFTLDREPPALEQPREHSDPNRAPACGIEKVSAVEVLQLGAEGEMIPPSNAEIASILDKKGPRGLFHPTPLSRFVKITNTRAYAPIRFKYMVFHEVRSYEEVTHPYDGRAPSSDQLPPLWSEPLRPEQQVTTRRVPIRAQERVATCPRCTGTGRLTCTPCGGDGRNSCNWCGGNGYTTRTVNEGNKSWQKHDTCTWCNGSGWTTCSDCSGQGRVTCDVCGGRTRVIYTWDRVEDFTAPTAMEALSTGRDWSGMSWMGKAEGELLFDRTARGMMELTETGGPIAGLADQVVTQHNHGLLPGHSYWSRLTVTRVPVVEVEYKVRNTRGVLHIYGRDRLVSMPGKKPVGCLGIMLWSLGASSALGFVAMWLASL